MASLAGQTVKIYLQHGDALFDISGNVRAVSVANVYNDLTELQITVIGHGVWTTGKELMSQAREITRHNEWQCDHCRQINRMDQRFCGQGEAHGCGASRPFIYE